VLAGSVLNVPFPLTGRTILIWSTLAVVQRIVTAAASPFRTHFTDTFDNLFSLAGGAGFSGLFWHGYLLWLNVKCRVCISGPAC
jgi:hypothetical protein